MWDKIISAKEFNNVYFEVKEFFFDRLFQYIITNKATLFLRARLSCHYLKLPVS